MVNILAFSHGSCEHCKVQYFCVVPLRGVKKWFQMLWAVPPWARIHPKPSYGTEMLFFFCNTKQHERSCPENQRF